MENATPARIYPVATKRSAFNMVCGLESIGCGDRKDTLTSATSTDSGDSLEKDPRFYFFFM